MTSNSTINYSIITFFRVYYIEIYLCWLIIVINGQSCRCSSLFWVKLVLFHFLLSLTETNAEYKLRRSLAINPTIWSKICILKFIESKNYMVCCATKMKRCRVTKFVIWNVWEIWEKTISVWSKLRFSEIHSAIFKNVLQLVHFLSLYVYLYLQPVVEKYDKNCFTKL